MNVENRTRQVVEVRPEVVFIYELLEELTTGRLKIPRFQRPFVWRRDQMTDLLDSVYNQYPIGSLLVWETEENIATLESLGPFKFPETDKKGIGYLLDGHQRLTTLAGALVPGEQRDASPEERDPGRWELVWNMDSEKFQHGDHNDHPDTYFPLVALLDTLNFFAAVDRVRNALVDQPAVAESRIQQLSRVARSFQHYRVPVIRIKQTGLSEAVEIFARLNSKGQSMTADQMVSALMYSSDRDESVIDLAHEIDKMLDDIRQRGFGDIERTAILRAILANLDEDIYNTDWTRLASARRKDLGDKLKNGVVTATRSLHLALDFLDSLGVRASRVLPYSMQLVVLSAAFDAVPNPNLRRLELLKRWFWVSSFSGWFGAASTSRVNALVAEVRSLPHVDEAQSLENFNLQAPALPYPSSFDMRSSRTRSLLLVELAQKPRFPTGDVVEDPWQVIADRGPDGVGFINDEIPKDYAGNPANRMIRIPGAVKGVLWRWIVSDLATGGVHVLNSHCLNERCVELLRARDIAGFIEERQKLLMTAEVAFLREVGVTLGQPGVGLAPIDTD